MLLWPRTLQFEASDSRTKIAPTNRGFMSLLLVMTNLDFEVFFFVFFVRFVRLAVGDRCVWLRLM